MHIALLMANTDDSAFAQSRPKDGEKFASMLHLLRPDWQLTVFAVKDGIFPPEDARFDGWMISGSPASVLAPLPGIPPLLALIRRLVAESRPIFATCFGPQAVALALGGEVGENPSGWVFGLTETEMEGEAYRLYAAHHQQVLRLPEGAERRGGNAACPIGSFAIGTHVLTTQYHPEILPDFMADLTEELASDLPAGVIAAARAELAADSADTQRIGARIVRFFEEARR